MASKSSNTRKSLTAEQRAYLGLPPAGPDPKPERAPEPVIRGDLIVRGRPLIDRGNPLGYREPINLPASGQVTQDAPSGQKASSHVDLRT